MNDHTRGPIGEIGARPTCGSCGSEDVVREASASWNPETGFWQLKDVVDACSCDTCEKPTMFVWKHAENARALKIRALNDQLRTNLQGGKILMTPGISSLGEDAVQSIVKTLCAFDDFSEDNDPHGEHDFGAFRHDDQKIFWKIDYYDRDCRYGSENPSDPEMTMRVLTVMLAEEY